MLDIILELESDDYAWRIENEMKVTTDIIAGAGTNVMKIAPIIEEIEGREITDLQIGYRVIHTGQHYDRNMYAVFFDQLGTLEPRPLLPPSATIQGRLKGPLAKSKSLAVNRCEERLANAVWESSLHCNITRTKVS